MSNSGSYYLEQLLDGHPNILSLPYSGQVFWNVYENRLKTLEGEELLYEMMAQMLGYLHSQYENLFCIREHKFEEYCVNQDGEFIYDVLIDPTEFYYRLKEQFEDNIKLNSYAQMLKYMSQHIVMHWENKKKQCKKIIGFFIICICRNLMFLNFQIILKRKISIE